MAVVADTNISGNGNLAVSPQRPRKESLLTQIASTSLGRYLGMALLLLILAFLTLYPMSMLFYGSLHSTPPGMAGEFNLDGYRQLLTREALTILLNTIGISLGKTIPSLV